MRIEAKNPDEYVSKVPEERREAFVKLRETIQASIPKGFEETMSYGMIGYVVPKTIYPDGYHCSPELPLPFTSIANQKNFIGFYHMGVYANKEIYDWFVEEYGKRCKYKIDMGKSCLRLKRMDDIPFDLIAELMKKMTTKDWISSYEAALKK